MIIEVSGYAIAISDDKYTKMSVSRLHRMYKYLYYSLML